MALPEDLAAYLREFAAGRFFEAHEALEPLWWQRDSDPLLQGLILFAAAFVKLQRGAPVGAARHFAAVVRYLEPCAPQERGLPVAAVLAHAREALLLLAAGATDVPDFHFALPADAAERWEAEAAPAGPAPDLSGAIAAALAARRATGAPLGPASWGELAREVARTTAGRVPRPVLRQAVRAALAGAPGPEGAALPSPADGSHRGR